MVEFLVHSGAQIASQGHDGNDPFAAACWKNHYDTVCFLLKHGISNLNERKYNGESCLFGACWLGNLEIAEILIRYGADVNTVESRGYSSLDSALTRAAFRGFADIVKLLLANGADVHQTNRDGLTALIKGSECCFNFNFSCGHLETVKMLIEAGSDVNKVGTYGHTALFMACSRGNTHIVNLLIQNGAAADTLHRGSTALMKACGVYLCEYELKHLETVKALIDHGVDVNAVGLNGTALTEATRLNCYEIVKFLVSEGADVNLANGNGETPLMIASQKNLLNASKKNNMKIMKFLVDVGAVASIHATKGRR
ncbi:hypothetical protein HDU99_002375 [Rhizoclosmatium hyalinum]|nr:hypothetical protein HDU99_002375 [Rhizoclosmatium hyalinum]